MPGYVIPLSILCLFSGVLTGVLASRRDRDGLLWGVIGAVFPFLGAVVLLCMPRICPRCKLPLSKALWQQHMCPFCNSPF